MRVWGEGAEKSDIRVSDREIVNIKDKTLPTRHRNRNRFIDVFSHWNYRVIRSEREIEKRDP